VAHSVYGACVVVVKRLYHANKDYLKFDEFICKKAKED